MTPQHSSSSDSDDNIESRVFRFGHLVRFSKIDEIPQFLNVLRGEMSVVGPRPHHLKDSVEFEARVPGYRQRFSVKPGITGLAQIREYAGEFQWDCTDSRVKADLDYIRNQSPWNDLHLIVRTFTTVLWKCQQRIFRSLIAVQEDQAETVVPFAEHAKPRTSEAKSDGRSSRKAA